MESDSLHSSAAFAHDLHEYLRQHIQFADQKAAFVFAAGATMLGILYTHEVIMEWWKAPKSWTFHSFVAFVASLGLAVGLAFAASVVIPRRKASPRGYIFWEAVLGFNNPTAYVSAVMELSADTLVREKLHHCYELASVCDRKYRGLALALRVSALGFLASVLYLFPI